MPVVVRAVAMLTAALALCGCTAGATTTHPEPAATVAAAAAGSDVGNDRPQVSYDGLMVRPRVVIAIHSTANADLTSLRTQLDLAATRRHTTLFTISASVLDPALLERVAPDLVVALPAGTTRADAGKLIDPSFAEGREISDDAQEYDVVRVLVHDLRFTVGTANPAVLAKAIAREGILADVLGNYTTTLGAHQLDVTYTGPLLSDRLVASVRNGIARRGDIAHAVVSVSPRSRSGVGVDMAREPAPAPAVFSASTGHHHTAELPAVARSSRPDPWTIAVLALTAGLSVTLLLLKTNRINRPDQS